MGSSKQGGGSGKLGSSLKDDLGGHCRELPKCFFSPFLLDQQDFLVTSLPVSCLEGKGFMGNKQMRVLGGLLV